MNPFLAELTVAQRRREMAAEAARQRLVALATCCRPGVLERAVARARRTWVRLTETGAATCCATA